MVATTRYPVYARGVLKAKVRELGSQKALAEAAGVTPALVNDVLHGRRSLSGALCDYLGLERHTVYYKKDTGA